MADRDKTKIFTTRGKVVIAPESLTKPGSPTTEYELGYTTSGIELIPGDLIGKFTVEEEGQQNAKAFWLGQNAQMVLTLRQWEADTLKTRFPGQFATGAGGGPRLQFPGDLEAGDDLDGRKVKLLIRPDDPSKDPYIFARAAMLVGDAQAAIPFRTVEPRALALVFDLYPDESIATGAADSQYKYRTLVVAKAADFTFAP